MPAGHRQRSAIGEPARHVHPRAPGPDHNCRLQRPDPRPRRVRPPSPDRTRHALPRLPRHRHKRPGVGHLPSSDARSLRPQTLPRGLPHGAGQRARRGPLRPRNHPTDRQRRDPPRTRTATRPDRDVLLRQRPKPGQRTDRIPRPATPRPHAKRGNHPRQRAARPQPPRSPRRRRRATARHLRPQRPHLLRTRTRQTRRLPPQRHPPTQQVPPRRLRVQRQLHIPRRQPHHRPNPGALPRGLNP
jgi:hypothetical protein